MASYFYKQESHVKHIPIHCVKPNDMVWWGNRWVGVFKGDMWPTPEGWFLLGSDYDGGERFVEVLRFQHDNAFYQRTMAMLHSDKRLEPLMPSDTPERPMVWRSWRKHQFPVYTESQLASLNLISGEMLLSSIVWC